MATNTYVALNTVTVVGSSTNTIEFASIPGTYTDLVIVANLRSSDSRSGYQSVSYTFNNAGSSQYAGTVLYGNGTAASSYRQPNESVFEGLCIMNGADSGVFYNNTLNIFNYADPSMYRTVLMEMSGAGLGTYKQVASWRNTTNAITSIQIKEPSNLAWVAGSNATLYGILREGATPTPKATGGVIYSDSSYYYHSFGFGGTFTPTQSLAVEYLIAAGGGGSGGVGSTWSGGGGGGGGQVRTGSSSLTAIGYPITVGAGGSGGTGGTAGSAGVASTFNSVSSSGGSGGLAVNGPGNNGGSSGGGFAGGTGAGNLSPGYGGGGGGGSSAVGGNATGTVAGVGGAGTTSTWQGLTSAIGGGGGGGTYNGVTSVSQGLGVDGGANGNAWVSGTSQNGNNAVGNRAGGGGGAGGGDNGGSYNGGNGGSGLVVIRYLKV
jgi:hypothetical protein